MAMADFILTTAQGDTFNVNIQITLRPTPLATPPTTPSMSSPTLSPEASITADVWEDEEGGHATEEVLSDLPFVKRQHMTDGYREGLSTSKAQVMQTGFDEGYPIGVQIAMRAAPILGVLEAYLACKSIDIIPGMRKKVQSTYNDAVHALDVTQLLQTTDEEALSAIKTIPESATRVISYWEGMVTAVYETRRTSMAIQERENPHALREMVELAKFKNPANFDTDHTDKASLIPAVQKERVGETQYRRKGRKP